MRAIDADDLQNIKFHPLPYTHITPSDVDAESYKRGWNDAIDAIIEDAPTIEPQPKRGKWGEAFLDHVRMGGRPRVIYCCECCQCVVYPTNFCPHCGADMRGE